MREGLHDRILKGRRAASDLLNVTGAWRRRMDALPRMGTLPRMDGRVLLHAWVTLRRSLSPLSCAPMRGEPWVDASCMLRRFPCDHDSHGIRSHAGTSSHLTVVSRGRLDRGARSRIMLLAA